MILLLFIWFIAGCCKGVTDSICFHNGYSHWGWFFDQRSWTDKKLFGMFVFNGWHLLDYIRTGISMVSLLLISSLPLPHFAALIIPSFVVGFLTTYK